MGKITKKDVEALNKALEVGNLPHEKGEIFKIEPLSYRYTTRGNSWLYRHNVSGEVMEIFCSDCDGVDGTLVRTDTHVQWKYDECECIAERWDNRPEFKDDRRGALDLVEFDMFKLRRNRE